MLALAGVGALVEIREAGRYPDGRYDLLAAATGRFTIDAVDPGREPYLVADVTPLEDEVGDEARAERLAASAIRRFVRYLELMRAREGETSEVLDIRVEVDSVAADDSEPDDVVIEDAAFADDADDDRDADARTTTARTSSAPDRDPRPNDDATSSSRTTRPCCPTCCRASSRSSCPAARRCSRRPRPTERLEALVRLLEREVLLLGHRLRLFAPDPRHLRGPRRS